MKGMIVANDGVYNSYSQYKLVAVTCLKGGHYRAALKLSKKVIPNLGKSGWFGYDDLTGGAGRINFDKHIILHSQMEVMCFYVKIAEI